MNWVQFVYIFTFLVLLATAMNARKLTGRWWAFCRTIALACFMFFLMDYIANHRNLWGFKNLCGIYLYINPLENTLITADLVIVLILIHINFHDRNNQKT